MIPHPDYGSAFENDIAIVKVNVISKCHCIVGQINGWILHYYLKAAAKC